jgi:cysteine-rich CPCC protein
MRWIPFLLVAVAFFFGARSRIRALRRLFEEAGSSPEPPTSPRVLDRRQLRELEDSLSDFWSDEDWSDGRPVCPCCGCITERGAWVTCSVCDWEEPLADDPNLEIAATERDAILAESRERYRATGSVLSDEDRATWGGELTDREKRLRTKLREACDYLRVGDRPDASERFEEIDRLLAELREEANRKRAREAEDEQ